MPGRSTARAATAEVARIVLEDAAKIQEEDAEYLNRRAIDPNEPRSSRSIAPPMCRAVLKAFKACEYEQKTDLGKGVSFTFFDAGHILGSAYVVLEWTEADRAAHAHAALHRRRRALRHADHPRSGPPPGRSICVITESTYGERIARADRARSSRSCSTRCKSASQHRAGCSSRRSRSGARRRCSGTCRSSSQRRRSRRFRSSSTARWAWRSARSLRVPRELRRGDRELLGQKTCSDSAAVTFASSIASESRKINNDRGPCVIIASAARRASSGESCIT